MLDAGSLGIAPAKTSTPKAAAPVADEVDPHALVPGSMLAKTLYHAWSGTPVVIVNSPPGAGKTTTLVQLAIELLARTSLTVAIVCPTRRGVVDVVARLVAAAEADLRVAAEANRIRAVGKGYAGPASPSWTSVGRLKVGTVASAKIVQPTVDVMIFDEAYQSTVASATPAAENAQNILMIGDPGQIGPVATTTTGWWDRVASKPHARAPEVFGRVDNAAILHLEGTYRLGPETVKVIAPLYDFEFASLRPDRHLLDADGQRVREINVASVPNHSATDDADTMRTVLDHALRPLREHWSIDEGNGQTRRLIGTDVAVVVAHNDQQTVLNALASQEGYSGLSIGTADSLQGGQWQWVVSLDPVFGHSEVSTHQLSPGRLCVMLSRHMSAMTWVTTDDSIDVMDASETPEAALGAKVRRRLRKSAR